MMELEAEAAFRSSVSKNQWCGDDVFALSRSNTVEDWKQSILSTLERQDSGRCSLLTLMTAARLQSRTISHPFNEALSALLTEKRVQWSELPGEPIQIKLL